MKITEPPKLPTPTFESLNLQGLLLRKADDAVQNAMKLRVKHREPSSDRTKDFLIPLKNVESSLDWISRQLLTTSSGEIGYRTLAAKLASTDPKAEFKEDVNIFHYNLFKALDLLIGVKMNVAVSQGKVGVELIDYDRQTLEKLIGQIVDIVNQTIKLAGVSVTHVEQRLSAMLNWSSSDDSGIENKKYIQNLFSLPDVETTSH